LPYQAAARSIAQQKNAAINAKLNNVAAKKAKSNVARPVNKLTTTKKEALI